MAAARSVRSMRVMRIVFSTFIFCRRGFCLAAILMFAQCWAVAQVKVRQIKEISTRDLAGSYSRVLIVLDSPIPDYEFQADNEKFRLVMPRTSLTQPPVSLTGAYIKSIDLQERAGNLVMTLVPANNARPRVEQYSTFLLLFFTPTRSTTRALAIGAPAATGSKPAGIANVPPNVTRPRVANLSVTLPPASQLQMMPVTMRSAIEPAVVEAANFKTKAAEAAPMMNPISAKAMRIPKVSQAPTLENFLQGSPREAEMTVSDFRQLRPGDGQPSSQPTRAFVSYDKDNLYVVFVCTDEPGKIRAHISPRENIDADDTVSVTLDTFHDRRRAYTFVVNPLGVQLDGIITEGQSTDYSFDTVWSSEGRLTPDGYAVRISIPFKSLRFSGAQLQEWGIALGRSIVRNNEDSYWPYITERVQGFVPQLATAGGMERISPGRNIELRPYASYTNARTVDFDPLAVSPYRGKSEMRGGVDAKVVLRDALTLDLTANPDFSQVESDEPQVIINQRYEVFFPEKRPFFLENAGFFRTPEMLFFSRRIVDPQLGARLTGKLGKWAVGGLLMDDRAAGRVLSGGAEEGRGVIGVARIQREFGEQSSVGMLATSQDYRGSSNRVFSLDGRIQINPNWAVTAQAARSYTRDLDGSHRAGTALRAQLIGSGRNFNYGGTYVDRSPGFHSNLAYVPRVGIRQVEQYANYRWRPDSNQIVSLGPSGYALFNWNRKGELQDWYADAGFGIQLKRQTFLDMDRAESYELYEGQGFRTQQTTVSIVSDPIEWVGFSASYSSGTSINYGPPTGLLPYKASGRGGNFTITFRPTSRASFYQSYLYRQLATRSDVIAVTAAGTSIFNNHILRTKVNYQFTRKLSLRFILDYDAVLPNMSLIALEHEKRITPDLLLTYLVNPGTAIYVGYTDRYENLLLAPGNFTRFGAPTTPTDRQFFVKVSYLFRY